MIEHKNMKGSITISRPRGSHGPEMVYVELTDELSGTRVVTAKIPVEQFADVLFGMAYTPCVFDFYPELVGLKYEHKEEFVPFDNPGYFQPGEEREKVAAKVFTPFEMDGWKGRVDDLFNPHRRGKNGSRVTFVRYIAPPAPVVEKE